MTGLRVAAIDCGTNTVRLLIADVGSRLVDVTRQMQTVRLGQDVDRSGQFAPAGLERLRATLTDYAGEIERAAPQRVRMVATSATRDVSNRDEFLAIVADTLGVVPEVASGAEEAELSFRGATSLLGDADGDVVVIDIGGGSTELVRGRGSVVSAGESLNVGAVRLTERHVRNDPPTPAELDAIRADVRAVLVGCAVPLTGAARYVTVAGTATTIAAMIAGLEIYDSERVDGFVMSVADIDAVATRLQGMSADERAGIGVLHPGRRDVITAGATILVEVLRACGAREAIASEHDILDGIALSLTAPPTC